MKPDAEALGGDIASLARIYARAGEDAVEVDAQ